MTQSNQTLGVHVKALSKFLHLIYSNMVYFVFSASILRSTSVKASIYVFLVCQSPHPTSNHLQALRLRLRGKVMITACGVRQGQSHAANVNAVHFLHSQNNIFCLSWLTEMHSCKTTCFWCERSCPPLCFLTFYIWSGRSKEEYTSTILTKECIKDQNPLCFCLYLSVLSDFCGNLSPLFTTQDVNL